MKVVAEAGARPITASRNSISSGVSAASSAIERAEERDTSETAEDCGGVEARAGMKDMRGRERGLLIDRDAGDNNTTRARGRVSLSYTYATHNSEMNSQCIRNHRLHRAVRALYSAEPSFISKRWINAESGDIPTRLAQLL